MTAATYKAGDRVRVINADNAALLERGATGTVVHVSETGSLTVRYDGYPLSTIGPTGAGRFELEGKSS
jgi:hypothetical protein